MAGQKAQIRGGWESSLGVPGHDMDDLPFSTESLTMEYPPVESKNIDPSGYRPAGEILSAHGSGSITAETDSESFLKTDIHMHADDRTGKAFFVQENQATGVERYTLRDFDELEDDLFDYYAGSMHHGVWRDQLENPTEYHTRAAKASKMTLNVKAGQFAIKTYDFNFLRETYTDDPSEIAVNAAFTGEMFVDGLRAVGDANGDEYNIKVPVGGGGALGASKFVFGKNGVYGTTEYTTAAVMDIRNADDTLASGDPKIPYRLLIIPGGVFTAGDEWKIDPVSQRVTPVYSSRPKLNGAAAMVEYTLFGSPIRREIEEWTAMYYVPREVKANIGSIYDVFKLPDDARRYCEFSWNGTYLNLELEQAAKQNKGFAIHAILYGGYIGSTLLQDFEEFNYPDMRLVSGAGATIQNAGDNAENPTFRSHRGGYTHVIQNTIASVEPT